MVPGGTHTTDLYSKLSAIPFSQLRISLKKLTLAIGLDLAHLGVSFFGLILPLRITYKIHLVAC